MIISSQVFSTNFHKRSIVHLHFSYCQSHTEEVIFEKLSFSEKKREFAQRRHLISQDSPPNCMTQVCTELEVIICSSAILARVGGPGTVIPKCMVRFWQSLFGQTTEHEKA